MQGAALQKRHLLLTLTDAPPGSSFLESGGKLSPEFGVTSACNSPPPRESSPEHKQSPLSPHFWTSDKISSQPVRIPESSRSLVWEPLNALPLACRVSDLALGHAVAQVSAEGQVAGVTSMGKARQNLQGLDSEPGAGSELHSLGTENEAELQRGTRRTDQDLDFLKQLQGTAKLLSRDGWSPHR